MMNSSCSDSRTAQTIDVESLRSHTDEEFMLLKRELLQAAHPRGTRLIVSAL
jgi:hypothetical protein